MGGELSYAAVAMEREQSAYSLLLPLAGVVLADLEPTPPRLGRGCIALAIAACVHAVASSHRLADTIKVGGELSYTAVAMEREQIVHSSLMTLAGAVLADPKPMLARLVHDCIALAFTACVPAVACSHCLADTVKRVASSATWQWRWNASNPHTARY